MGKQKQVLIITDDDASIRQIAKDIAAVIGNYPGYRAEAVQAENFTGVELLPSCVFFLGCGKAGPSSFKYLEEMLGHINLAGRPCGVFSANSPAIKYLSDLLRPSEAAAGKPLLAKDGGIDTQKLQSWVQCIVDTGKA